jgi:hypothetical protein
MQKYQSSIIKIEETNQNVFFQTKGDDDEEEKHAMTSDDGNDSLDDVINNLTSEKFQKASPSLFDDSSVFQKDSERSSSSDFMAHQVGTFTRNQIDIFSKSTNFPTV